MKSIGLKSAPLLAVALLIGCAARPVQLIQLKSTFDELKAKTALEPGARTIIGSAVIRQNGGTVVTCAGLDIALIPKTPHAIERMRERFGSSKYGYRGYYDNVAFEPDDPAYHRLQRTAACNAQGFFTFKNVKPGEYFLTSTIIWLLGSNSPIQGGDLMQSVVVDQSDIEVVLRPSTDLNRALQIDNSPNDDDSDMPTF